MNQAPQELLDWARELDEAMEGLLQNEGNLQTIIGEEIQEGEEIIKEEKEEIDFLEKVEVDVEDIQSDLQEIQTEIQKMAEIVEGGYDQPIAGHLDEFKEKFESFLVKDIKEIKQDIGEIESIVSKIKEENMEELQEVEVEVNEYRTTYEILVEADNRIGEIDEMVNALEKTARGANDPELSRLINDIEQKRQNLEERLSELEEEESQVGREIKEEENAIMEEIGLEREIMKELRTEASEEGQILTELAKIEEAIEEFGDHDLAEHIETFRKHLESIEEETERIFAHTEEMEEVMEKAEQDLESAAPQ